MRAAMRIGVYLAAIVWMMGCSSKQVLELGLRGVGYEWQISYPGDDGKLGTEDDQLKTGDIALPAKTRIILHITSGDYIYQFNLPDRKLSQMAVPDLVFPLEFASGAPGVFPFLGDQMCGFTHETLKGQVLVLKPKEFQEWLKKVSTGVDPP